MRMHAWHGMAYIEGSAPRGTTGAGVRWLVIALELAYSLWIILAIWEPLQSGGLPKVRMLEACKVPKGVWECMQSEQLRRSRRWQLVRFPIEPGSICRVEIEGTHPHRSIRWRPWERLQSGEPIQVKTMEARQVPKGFWEHLQSGALAQVKAMETCQFPTKSGSVCIMEHLLKS
jgi:hypothetical protein